MTAMERRRLQLYARSTRLQHLQRQIEVLEELLGPLYREAEQWRQSADPDPTGPTTPTRKKISSRESTRRVVRRIAVPHRNTR